MYVCRNTKAVETISLFGVPLSNLVALKGGHAVRQGHVHNWFLYSRGEEFGFRGWLGSSVRCKSQMYRDGGRATFK